MIQNIPLTNKGLIKDKRQKLVNSIKNSDSIENIYNSVLKLWINPNENILCDKYKKINMKESAIPSSDSIAEKNYAARYSFLFTIRHFSENR